MRIINNAVVVVALGSALAVGGGAPLSAAATTRAVTLTSSDSFQPTLQELLDAVHAAAAKDAALPFAPEGSEGVVTTMLQNTNYELLMSGISRVTELFNGWFFQSPEVVAADASDTRQYFQFFTPDIYYHVTAGLHEGATYKLTGTLGGGTEAFAIATEKIDGASAVTQGSLELDHGLVVNPDGTFTVYIGPTAPPGAANFLDDTTATQSGAASLLIRDMMGNWAQGGSNVSLQCISDCPPFFAIPSGGLLPTPDGGDAVTDVAGTKITSIDSLLSTLFGAFAQIVPQFNDMNVGLAQIAGINEPVNSMSALQSETDLFPTGLPSAAVSAGNFDLDPGQALIVKVPDVAAGYSGIELMNVFGGGLPSTLSQTTLNNTTAFHSADGYTYYVVSATNPGVANWLDSGDTTRGEIFARFENLPDGADPYGEGVTTQLVDVADVAKYLPTDTPTVSPEEYAADMAQRVFSFDYALDASRMHAQPAWLLQEGLLYGMKGLVGEDDFQKVFGEQPATPIALRLTDALSPNWDAVTQDLTDHPTQSWTAILDNLQLAWSDISLPMQWAGIAPVLALLTGQNVGTALQESLLNPSYGILAGFLNARDDLATAILTANNNFPTELGATAAHEWANMSDLVANTPPMTLGDLGSLLLNPGEFFGGA
ncbi:hypothetical protein KIH27_01695 [Mycobacterium sp. M1]|uniref:DUF1214 domain-containing protein n=1 Tax=Mycolicibacter acidiphilus TaxID=2835306 RepID=A0ABS5RDD7_9MYCO|nr:hypothetical protein [Mycolicibacter acidiphilus]MBS9532297.1 hypothetical protein [Mycolicibacter acidiphilus]